MARPKKAGKTLTVPKSYANKAKTKNTKKTLQQNRRETKHDKSERTENNNSSVSTDINDCTKIVGSIDERRNEEISTAHGHGDEHSRNSQHTMASTMTSSISSQRRAIEHFSQKTQDAWCEAKETFKHTIKETVNKNWIGEFKFDNTLIVTNVVSTDCLDKYKMQVTPGMTRPEFIDITSRLIVTKVFNDLRHNIESAMRKKYLSK